MENVKAVDCTSWTVLPHPAPIGASNLTPTHPTSPTTEGGEVSSLRQHNNNFLGLYGVTGHLNRT
jgi:hypothetical protein